MSSILLTNGALECEPKWGVAGHLRGLSQQVQLYTGAQINFGDIRPTCNSIFNLRLPVTLKVVTKAACVPVNYSERRP